MSAGNDVVRSALGMARSDANMGRLHGIGDNPFSRGMYVGKVIVAECWLNADPLLTMAALNEIRFLRSYSERKP